MMQNLKTDPVRVALQLVNYADKDSDGEGSIMPSINGRVYTQPTQFYALRCRAFHAAGGYYYLFPCRR